MTRCEAMAMVCRPDEQKRLIVMPEVVTGQPARIAICRAMFRPVAPSGLAHPMITSSMSPGSSWARRMAWQRAWPPIVAPWVMLNAPRQLLQSGVRAVETITASGMDHNLPHPHTTTAHRCTQGRPTTADKEGNRPESRRFAGRLLAAARSGGRSRPADSGTCPARAGRDVPDAVMNRTDFEA